MRKTYYKEYLYPDKHKMYILRVMLIILLILAAIFDIVIFSIFMIKDLRSAAAVLFFISFFVGYIGIPFFCSFVKETYYLRVHPFNGLKYNGIIIMNNREVFLYLGKRLIKSYKWEEIKLIQKYREYNKTFIAFITCDCWGKVKKDDRYKSYIETPARVSIEQAIKRFSNMEITLVKDDIYT